MSIIPFSRRESAADRLPPHNLEAEVGVLGSLLIDNDAFGDVDDLVSVDDFYRDVHQTLYQVIRDMLADGGAVDLITIAEELRRREVFDQVGGDPILAQLMDVPHSANAAYYAAIVRQKAIGRELIDAANLILRDGYSNQFNSDELVERAERAIFGIGDRRARSDVTTIGTAAREAMDRFHALAEGREAPGIPTGLVDLDNLQGGMRGSQLIVLAARPAMGKTSLAMNIAEFVAGRLERPVLFVSLEMNRQELAERVLASRAGVSGDAIRLPNRATDRDRRGLDDVVPILDGLPLWIDDTPSPTAPRIAAVARRHKARHGLALIVVDYLQLIAAENPREPRQEQVASITRRLKALAREVDAPVLALCQLNRDVDKREVHRPRLADLRESGQIEQDAHVVMFVHRPEYYDPNDQPGLAELIVAKNRTGPTGLVRLVFEKQFTRFSSYHADVDTAAFDDDRAY